MRKRGLAAQTVKLNRALSFFINVNKYDFLQMSSISKLSLLHGYFCCRLLPRLPGPFSSHHWPVRRKCWEKKVSLQWTHLVRQTEYCFKMSQSLQVRPSWTYGAWLWNGILILFLYFYSELDRRQMLSVKAFVVSFVFIFAWAQSVFSPAVCRAHIPSTLWTVCSTDTCLHLVDNLGLEFL